MARLKVKQDGTPVYAGVCVVCWCVYDSLGRRTRCLSAGQIAVLKSKGFKLRGWCHTCRTVMSKAAKVRAQRQDERAKGFHEKDFFDG